MDLFVQRAQAVKPDFRLTAANAATVSAICHRLDGLPLAIELAAARSRLLSPAALLARLERRLQVLTAGPADRPARQQTLRDAIAWSHDLLGGDERQLFRRLTVFVGGGTLEAVDAVCGEPDDGAASMIEGVASLVDQGLVRVTDEADMTRLTMLETIREYGREQLTASGETRTIQERHVRWFLAFAEEAQAEIGGSETLTWLTRLEAEHDNLRAALTWARDAGAYDTALHLAAALWRFWYTRGYFTEGRAWLENLLAAHPAASPRLRAQALLAIGRLTYGQTDFPQALALLNASAALWREIGDNRSLAETIAMIGGVTLDTGKYAETIALEEEAIALHRQVGDQRGMALSLNIMASALRHQGERTRALQVYEEALALRRAEGDRASSASILMNIGQVLQELGEYERADDVLIESMALHGGKGDKAQTAYALNTLGSGARDRGDYARATEYHKQSLAIFRAIGSKAEVARTLINLGIVAHGMGDDERAAVIAEESLALARATNHARNTAYALICLVDIARGQRKWDMARARYRESLGLFHSAGNPLGMTETIERLGLLAVDMNSAEAAARMLGFSGAMREKMQTPIPPADRPDHARARAVLCADPDADRWVAAGAALSPDEAVAETTCDSVRLEPTPPVV